MYIYMRCCISIIYTFCRNILTITDPYTLIGYHDQSIPVICQPPMRFWLKHHFQTKATSFILMIISEIPITFFLYKNRLIYLHVLSEVPIWNGIPSIPHFQTHPYP